MRYFWKKQIHSCCATVSSGDAWLTREITADTFKVLREDAESESVIMDKVSVVYLDADKRFYYGGLRSEPSKELFQAYVQAQCEAFNATADNEFLDEALREHWAKESEREREQRRAEGFLFPSYDDQKDAPAEAFQGGLSNVVFQDPKVQRYVSSKGVFGYLGHFVRKPDVDAYLEKSFLEKSTLPLFALWLTSTSGRHFGDSLEDSIFAEQCAYIDKSVDGLIADAERYAKEEAV